MNEYRNPPSMNHNGELLSAGRRILKDTKNTFITTFPDYELIANEHMLNEPAFPNDPRWKKYNFKGYIDTIIKTQNDDICLIDQKTCGWGWDAKKKNDKMKQYRKKKEMEQIEKELDEEETEESDDKPGTRMSRAWDAFWK